MHTSLERQNSIMIKNIGFEANKSQLKSYFYSLLAQQHWAISYISKPVFFSVYGEYTYLEGLLMRQESILNRILAYNKLELLILFSLNTQGN